MNARKWILVFFLFAVAVSGVGFSVKIVEFTDDLTAESGLQFAGAHLLTYGLVAGGFLLLLLFAFLCGHFKDVEEPKYDLLEKERRHDARSARV